MAARIAGSAAGDSWAAERSQESDRPQPVGTGGHSLLFLIVVGIVAAVSTGGLLAAGFLSLPQPKAAKHPVASSASAAAPPVRVAATAAVASAAPPVEKPARKKPAAPAATPSEPPRALATPATAPAAPPAAAAISVALGEGDANFRDGVISTARFYYEQGVDAGSAEAALRLGETFDPAFLTKDHLRRSHADPAAARYWYGRARDLGSSVAKMRIANLDAEPADRHRESRAPDLRRRETYRQPESPPPSAMRRLLDRILRPPAGG
jgi:hypothetical protein